MNFTPSVGCRLALMPPWSSPSARTRVLSLVAGVFASVLVSSGCDEPQSSSDDGNAQPSDELPEPPLPGFIEPASGTITIAADRTNDIRWRVSGVVIGTTQVLLDGTSLGTLQGDNRYGRLTPEALELRLHGAMVPTEHTIELVTPGPVETLVSAPVLLTVEPPLPPERITVAQLHDTGVPATAVVHRGIDERGLLLAFDGASSSLHLVRQRETGWDFEGRSDPVSVTDLVVGPDEAGPAIAASIDPGGPRSDEDPDPWTRVAWRTGYPGDAVRTVAGRWSELSGRPAKTVLDAAAIDGREFVAIEAVSLVGDTLLASSFAPSDVENVGVDDHRLVQRWLGRSDEDLARLRDVSPENNASVDLLGPAHDLGLHAIGQAGFIARIGHVDARLLVVDRDSGRASFAVQRDEGLSTSLSGATMDLSTVIGAFEGRTLATWTADGPLLLAWDVWGEAGRVDVSPTDGLPPGGPSGPLAMSVLGGLPVVLVPYGNDAPVHALVVVGGSTQIHPLEGLSCTSIAIPASFEVAHGDTSSIACAGEERLWTAEITLVR